jgi:hypothetical protein
MSIGSNPATTTGTLCRSTNFSNTPQPVIVAAWPAAESFDARVGHLRHDLHHRRDVLVRRENRKVRRRIVEDHGRRCDRGGLEAGGKQHDLFPAPPRQIHRLPRAVHDLDVGAARFRVCKGLHRPRNLQHVAEGRDLHALLRKHDAFVDLRHIGHADRAARAHDHVETLWKQRAQTELRDRLLVASADVHDRDLAPISVARERGSHRSSELRIAEFEFVIRAPFTRRGATLSRWRGTDVALSFSTGRAGAERRMRGMSSCAPDLGANAARRDR